MIIATTKEIQEFCKKNKLKFHKELNLIKATRTNAESRVKKNLLIQVEDLQDFMKQKNSAIDQVICKIIKEKEKNVYFDLNELLNSKHKSFLIARIRQNIKLLKKYKINYEFIYFCDTINEVISEKDVISLQRVLELKEI